MLNAPASVRHITQNWIVRKPAVHTAGGLVTSQSRLAAEAGASVLSAGGNAVDAAVAAGFALAAVEPWNSGLGGIGHMLVWVARERRAYLVEFGPISPARLDPREFPLIGGAAGDLFAWPAVAEDRNVHGALSIAVPGEVDGLGLALERFGTWPLARALEPAIALADAGLAVDWYTTLRVSLCARDLARYRDAAAIWLPEGLPPITAPGSPLKRLSLGALPETLRRLASAGRRDFYAGEIARALVADIKAAGGVLDTDDFARYCASIRTADRLDYRGVTLHLAGALTAAPTLAASLQALAGRVLGRGEPGAAAFLAYAESLSAAYAERLETLGEKSDARAPACTTHLNTIDRDGNMVALTQTLLSVFGSKVVSPSTGILFNNGVMWFDPRPGRPNSLAPAKRPLTNMCPVLGTKDGAPWLAIGGSGGRKIMPAVMQIISFLADFGMDLESAFHAPRIDASGEPAIGVDLRLPADVVAALSARFAVRLAEHGVLPTNFACPCAIVVDPETGVRTGIADVMSPWSAAIAAGDGIHDATTPEHRN